MCVNQLKASMRVPGLQLQAFAVRNVKFASWYARRQASQGEEVTLVELVFGSDSKVRGLPRPYMRPVFKTSLFSGWRPRRRLYEIVDLIRFSETRWQWCADLSRIYTRTLNKREPTSTLVTVLLRIPSTSAPANCKDSRSWTRRDSSFSSRFSFSDIYSPLKYIRYFLLIGDNLFNI